MSEEEILRNHAEPIVKTAIEANFARYIKTYWRQVEVIEEHQIFRFYTSVPVAVKNGVMWARFTTRNAKQKVAEVVRYFKERGVPFLWWIGSSSSPKNLGDLILEEGLIKEEWSFPAMALDLRELDHALLPDALNKSGIQIRQVKTVEDLDQWFAYLTNRSYPEPAVQSMYDMLIPALAREQSDIRVFLALLDGGVVGVSKVAYLVGVAGLYWIDTQPEHRGKGIGTATTLVALQDACERGYEISTLQSSQLGYNLYSRIGFKPYYLCDVYRFTPEEPVTP